MPNTFDWIVASGAFGAASSWSLGAPGEVSGPPTSSDYAEIYMAANIFGTGVAENLDINAAVTISSPLTTTVGGSTTVGANGVGSVTVTSTWNAAGYLQVGGYPNNGDAYAGTLTIDAGGFLDNTTTNGVNIGNNPGGTGTLIVQGGGRFTTQANYLTIGANSGATGVATITGAGSTVTVAGAITVGNSGDGQLTISDGGSLFTDGTTDDNFYDVIGNAPGSVGSVTVTGAGSTWKSANDIQVGDAIFYDGGGTATLSATDGGFVQSAQGLSIFPGGTISVDATSVIESGATGGAEAGFLTLDADGGYLYGDGTVDANVIDNNGINAIDGGPMTINGAVTGDGTMNIGTDGDLVLNDSVAATGGVNFYNWYGTLALGDPGQFGVPVTNFMPGDTIDLTNTPYDGADSSYNYIYGAPNQLVVTEGSNTYTLDVNSTVPLSGTLKLEEDASGDGTDIVFASTPASPFNIWSTLPNFFSTSSGPVNGEDWALSNSTDGGNPLWVDTETPASTYAPGVAGDYTIVMTTQDWLGDEQSLVTVATDTDIVDPFGHSASAIGNLAGDVIFSSNNTTGDGAILYWQDSATPGDYALELQPTTTTYQTAPSAGPSTVLTGSPVTMLTAVADPTNWNFTSGNSTTLVLGYTTAVTSTTEDLWYQAFTNTGVATSPDVEVAANIPDSTQYYVGYNNGNYYYRYTIVNGSSTGLYGGTFNSTTGALGTLGELVPTPSFTSFSGVASRTLSSGNSLRFLEGVENGQAVIQTFVNSDSTPNATFDLTNADDHFGTANVYDPNDGQLDYTVLAYTDNNQVHLELLDENGHQIGSDFVAPGLTSFDRIHTLQGRTLDSAKRVEIDYTVADPSGGTEIEGVIYSTAGSPYVYTLGSAGSNEYDGSPFDDTITYAPGVYFVDGGGGTDTFAATAFTPSQVSVTINATGNVVLSDGAGDVDTLRRFSIIDLSGATIAISGNVLTQNNSDHTKVVSTFNIGGDASSTTVADYNASASLVSETLTDVASAVTGSNAAVILNAAQAAVTGGADTIDVASGSGNVAALYSTGDSWDLANGSSFSVDLSSAQSAVSGAGDIVNFIGGSGNAVSLYDTGSTLDQVNGSNGSVYLGTASAQVVGGRDTIDFLTDLGNSVDIYGTTGGDWDLVYGSGGTIGLNGAQATVVGADDTIDFASGSDDAVSIYNTGAWDQVNGSSGTIYLNSAQATVVGADDIIDFASGSDDAVSIYNTGAWDVVNGSDGTIYLNGAQATVVGADDTIDFTSGSDDAVSIYNTGAWDQVNGSGGTVYLNSAQATVVGSGDTIDFAGSGDAVSLYGAAAWDPVIGSGGTIDLNGAQAAVTGGADTVNFASGSGNAASFYGGGGDTVNGANGTVYLISAQAAVAGSDDTIDFHAGSGNAVTLSDTSAGEDLVSGSNGTVTLTNAQASVGGGGDTIDLEGRSSGPNGNGGGAPDMVRLHGTDGNADVVNGSAATIHVINAQASVVGEGDTIYLVGASVSQNGASDQFIFRPAFGVDTIDGFASTDTMQFSTADFANWSTLLGHISQSESGALITFDASDTVTLTGVTATTLTASQFQFG